MRTNDQILSKAREFIDKGMPPKQEHDQIHQLSGGVFAYCITRLGARRDALSIPPENKDEIC